MRPRLWMFPEINAADRQGLVRALSISPVTASVLLARGIDHPHEANQWLQREADVLHDPMLLPDIQAGIDRLHRAVTTDEQVCFYGDYDVDGMSATSLYVTIFRALGLRAIAYIPHRMREGYGLNCQAVEHLKAQGVSLLVTSDCGTTSHKEIARATELGMDVLVTDHHQTDESMPSALAVMNPHRRDSQYPFPALCSAALAYKVCEAYLRRYGGDQDLLKNQLDLVALATVADVVPLVGENRVFVRQGLALLTQGLRPGLRALKRVASIDRPCTTGAVSFKLVPRLNAAGRLDHAMLGVHVLTSQEDAEAEALAQRLDALNRERQQIEEQVVREVEASLPTAETDPAIVAWSRGWHLGVVGIAAARMVDHYHRPSVVLSVDAQGIAKGSVRSIPGFDAYAALAECRDLLVAFGGHPGAAGLTVREDQLPAFRERFQSVAAGHEAVQRDPTLRVDAEVQLAEIDLRLIRELDRLHPFGAGNPEPTLAVRQIKVLDARVVGAGHLKLTVRQGNSFSFPSIGFRMGNLTQQNLWRDRPVDLAFVPEVNRWNGLEQIQLRIRDVRASDPN